jgi:AcrR family transcriptional regulator
MSSEERTEQILDITLALARKRGLSGLSIEAVAKAAGVTRPLVYSLFGDFDGLLDALIEREEGLALADLAVAIPDFPGEDDPDEVLERGVGLFLEAVQAQPDRWYLILLPPDGTPERLRLRIERNRAAILGQLEQLVAWGVRRRGGPHGIDTELLARLILTLAQDSARLVLTHPRKYDTGRILEFTAAALKLIPRGEPDFEAPAPTLPGIRAA